MKRSRNSSCAIKGFTLIELLAVVAIFGFLTSAVVSLYPNSAIRLKVANFASELQGDIRSAQLAASSVNSKRQTVAGYGLHFSSTDKRSYQLFEDRVTTSEVNGVFIGNQKYDGSNEDSEPAKPFLEGYSIIDACVNPSSVAKPFATCRSDGVSLDLTVLYKRPSAQAIIYINNSTSTQYASGCVTIGYDTRKASPQYLRSVIFTKTGLIEFGKGDCRDGKTVATAPPAAPSVTQISTAGVGLNIVDIVTTNTGITYTVQQDQSIAKIAVDGSVSTYGSAGHIPYAMTVDSSGTLYVLASTFSSTPIIVKLIPTGGLPAISTLPAPATTSLTPHNIAVDSSGFIYVADGASNIIHKIDPVAGTATTFGSTGPSPRGVVISNSGAVYSINQNTISRLTSSGALEWTTAPLAPIYSLAIDLSDTAYAVHQNTITVIDTVGTATAFASIPGASRDITIDATGSLYVPNVSPSTISKITSSGVVSTLGTTGTNPIAISSYGTTIYSANQGSDSVTKITQ